jgi:hypothetical protein
MKESLLSVYRSVRRLYNARPLVASLVSQSLVEAGSNTSTVALRVVGGDEKGSLESETVKFGRQSHGTRT